MLAGVVNCNCQARSCPPLGSEDAVTDSQILAIARWRTDLDRTYFASHKFKIHTAQSDNLGYIGNTHIEPLVR